MTNSNNTQKILQSQGVFKQNFGQSLGYFVHFFIQSQVFANAHVGRRACRRLVTDMSVMRILQMMQIETYYWLCSTNNRFFDLLPIFLLVLAFQCTHSRNSFYFFHTGCQIARLPIDILFVIVYFILD